MAALNILIVWCIIVVAMTVLISVRLFHKGNDRVHTQKILSERDDVMNDVKF